jgi:ketosteroid isomerase-like protein
MSEETAQTFAQDWYEAWNAHDLEAILEHYAEDVVFASPFVQQLVGEPNGEMRGKHELRHYFARALTNYPELCFEPIGLVVGVRSVVLTYKSVKGLVAGEYMRFDDEGKVCAVACHYTASFAGR